MHSRLRAITCFGLLLGVQIGMQAGSDLCSLKEQHDKLLQENRRLLHEMLQLQGEKNNVLARKHKEPATLGKRILAVGVGSGIGAMTRYGSKKLAMHCGGRSEIIMQGILMAGLDGVRHATVAQLIGEEYINLATGATWGSRAAMYFAERMRLFLVLLASPI